MVNCCVPYCTSYKSRTKKEAENGGKRVSYHEFPCDLSLRELWLKVISRKDFIINDKSGSSVVCSKHFKEEDFLPMKNGRRLKKNTIPSIFTNYPKYMHPCSTPKRAPKKRKPKDEPEMVMGRISCIVPGCQSYYSGYRKKNTSEGERNISLFLLPRDSGLFEKWKRAIPTIDIDLKKTDHVCELHFLENEIERFYITKLKDGSVNKIKKGRVTLKAGAVPSIFPDFSENVENEMLRNKHPVTETPKDNLSSVINLTEDVIVHNFSFEKLLRTVMFLKKPNNFWSITATPNFVIFARWNEDYVPEKKIVIEKNLNARVFLNEDEIQGTDLLEITSDDDIITLLQKVENYKFYTGASDNVC